MRSLPAPHYILLKTATRSLIAAAGGVEGAATLTRVGKSALSEYAHPDKQDCFMPIDVMVDLSVNSASTVLLDAIRAVSGEKPKCRTTLAASAAAVMSETGDVLKSAAKAMKDNKVTPRERRDVVLQAQEALTALVDLIAALKEDADDDA